MSKLEKLLSEKHRIDADTDMVCEAILSNQGVSSR
jgi:hypothetical protein